MRYRVPLGLAAVLLLLSGFGGLAWGTLSNEPRSFYSRTRYLFREALGLEKYWVTLPGSEQANDRNEIQCPDPDQAIVIVTGGQSNASNANSALSDTPPSHRVAVWFEGRCFPAEDPVLGATGRLGSLWPPMAHSVSESLDRPVLLINGAVGGTQVQDWLDLRSGYYDALVDRVASASREGFEPDLILWHQGESDALLERDVHRFRENFGTLMDRLHADMPAAEVYLFLASKCIGPERSDGVEAIRDAQAAIVETRDFVTVGMNTDELGNDHRWDTCHFNSAGRVEIVGEVVPDLIGILSASGGS